MMRENPMPRPPLGNVRSFGLATKEGNVDGSNVNAGDQKLSTAGVSDVQVRRLLEENARLRPMLIAQNVPSHPVHSIHSLLQASYNPENWAKASCSSASA
jgi:hypothetical protein